MKDPRSQINIFDVIWFFIIGHIISAIISLFLPNHSISEIFAYFFIFFIVFTQIILPILTWLLNICKKGKLKD